MKWITQLPIRLAIIFIYTSLLTLGSLDASVSTSSFQISDKILHFTAYAAFSVIAFFPPYRPARVLTIALCIFGYGVLIEYLQQMVGRQFSIYDIIANGVGVIVGTFLAIKFFPEKYNLD